MNHQNQNKLSGHTVDRLLLMYFASMQCHQKRAVFPKVTAAMTH